MRTIFIALVCLAAAPLWAQEAKVLDSMDDSSAWKAEKKYQDKIAVSADAEPKEGKGAVRFAVAAKLTYALSFIQPKGDPAWNSFDGLAFWIKGDASENFGELRIQAGTWDTAWVAAFPLKDKTWHEVKFAWGNLVPAGFAVPDLGSTDKFRPSDITLIAFGKSWNFNTKHESPEIAFSVDDLRLVKGVKSARARVAVDNFPPVSDVAKRMKAGEVVTILALGDSITWGTNVGGNEHSYPALLGAMLRAHYKNEKITVLNRAIGGSTTSKGREWLDRDVRGIEADLVTEMFGFNEMTVKPEDRAANSPLFAANLLAYAEEAAGTMKKAPALVLLATIPGKDKHWETLDCYADAVRGIAKAHPNVALADVNARFKALGKEKVASLMSDEAHPNDAGQKEMAKAVFEAITGETP